LKLSARNLLADEHHIQTIMGQERGSHRGGETTDAEKKIESGEFLKSGQVNP